MFPKAAIIYQCNTLTGTRKLLYILQHKVTADKGRQGTNGDEAVN